MSEIYYPHFLYTVLIILSFRAAMTCERKCGDLEIPYPFGVDDPSCVKDGDTNFVVKCNRTAYSPPKPFLGPYTEVLAISLENATISIRIFNSFQCYNESGPVDEKAFTQSISLREDSPFTFSSAENKLIGLGCDTIALMGDASGKFGSGCVSLCSEDVDFAKEGACSGFGCCQTSVPKNVKSLEFAVSSVYNHTNITGFNPCDFVLLVDQRTFNVSDMRLQFQPEDSAVEKASVLLDWVVGNQTCEDAKANRTAYACGPNTDCSYSDNALGYRCHCAKGFTGNPYLREGQGCLDIDECKEPEKYKCEGKCKNIIGDYECECPLGMRGDGKIGCQGFRVTTIASIIGASTFAVIIALLIVYECKRRRRDKIFRENGGLVLKHQRVRIFSQKDLAKATNDYHQNQFLGEGGFASVYKGALTEQNQTLEFAVKKPKDSDNKIEIDKQQFHEEIAIVSQVNHKNVVKLLGLCLETKIPLLVYECVPNGTLFKHIHSKKSAILRSWKNRLRIAVETAVALDYLHSFANPPIIHRDIKSTNILLDENYTAKVSDFGASVLIPPGQTWIATSVLGTPGYLDPEYLITGTLTTKSDVYSFGVVLVELITGEKPISKGRTGPKSNIIQFFISQVRENRHNYVDTILDVEVVRDEEETEQIEAVAELATRCLDISGAKRPSMKAVAEELSRLNKISEKNRVHLDDEETEGLLDKPTSAQSDGRLNRPSIELVEYTTYDITGYELEPSVHSLV